MQIGTNRVFKMTYTLALQMPQTHFLQLVMNLDLLLSQGPNLADGPSFKKAKYFSSGVEVNRDWFFNINF